jgi:hypothetical protein
MFRYDPHAAIRNCRFHLREHLLCSALLTFSLLFLTALLAFILSSHFASRSEIFSLIMDAFARIALSLVIAANIARLSADLWMTFVFSREIQSHSWAALSLHQG